MIAHASKEDKDLPLCQYSRMFDREAPIPWDKEVEIFSAETGQLLRVTSKRMTLQQAVEVFMDTPEEGRSALGVSVHEPYLTTMNGRPVAVGFLNASSLRVLADRLRGIHPLG
jgi:hypothetical protein